MLMECGELDKGVVAQNQQQPQKHPLHGAVLLHAEPLLQSLPAQIQAILIPLHHMLSLLLDNTMCMRCAVAQVPSALPTILLACPHHSYNGQDCSFPNICRSRCRSLSLSNAGGKAAGAAAAPDGWAAAAAATALPSASAAADLVPCSALDAGGMLLPLLPPRCNLTGLLGLRLLLRFRLLLSL
jgi:hypothetical protein